jgi:hypothetical protein
VRNIGTCDPHEKEAAFTIAHFNDLQARYSERIEGRSRYAYLAGYLEKLRAENPHTLVLDAGDDYEKGAIAELRSNGETTRRMLQALPIDVRTIGNHDFAYGEAAVLRDVRLSAHPVLAANVTYVRSGVAADEQPFLHFVRVDVGCVRVGVIGLVTQNYDADDLPTKKPFDGVFEQSTRYAEILEHEVNAHREDVDVLVALTHLGSWADTALAMSPAARGLDLVIGGHTEELFREPRLAVRPDGSRTWIVQAGHYARTLGRADLTVSLAKKSVSLTRYAIVDIDASLPVDEDVDALVAKLEAEAAPDTLAPIATTRAAVPPGRGMTDLVYRAATAEWGVDALLVGRDLFWAGLPRGPLSLQRLYDAVYVQKQPAGTSGFSALFVVDVSGAELTVLRSHVVSPLYEMYLPTKVEPTRVYHLALDTRALTYPRNVFGAGTKLPTAEDAAFRGELIDLLEAYARSRTARGQTLD